MSQRVTITTNAVPPGTSFPPLVLDGNILSAGSTRTLLETDHRAQVNLDTATGSVVTLPAATGSGRTYRFVVTVLATSNSHVVKVANASDFFVGFLAMTLSGTPTTNNAFPAANSGTVATNSDTVTLNRTTTGSVTVGEWIEVVDAAANTWHIRGQLSQSGVAATPFSAAV